MATTTNPKQTSGEIEVTPGRAKSENKTYKVSGKLGLNGTVLCDFPGGLITAKDEKQACRYALAHARYLGLNVIGKMAWKQV